MTEDTSGHGRRDTGARPWRWAGCLLLAVAMSMDAVSGAAGTTAHDPLEAAVKATYLPKFAAFVAWPDSAFADASSPFVLCVEGEDPFGELLDRAVAGQSVGTHPVILRRLPMVAPGSGCHLLYTTSPTDRLSGEPVLTVTDSARGAAQGAVITFVLRDDRVRFEIDADAARNNRLTISSKLLSLAVGSRR